MRIWGATVLVLCVFTAQSLAVPSENANDIRLQSQAVSEMESLAVSPDGRFAAHNEGLAVVLWDLRSSAVLRRWPSSLGVYHLQFSPDGQHLVASSSDEKIEVFDVASDQVEMLDFGKVKRCDGGESSTKVAFDGNDAILVFRYGVVARARLDGSQEISVVHKVDCDVSGVVVRNGDYATADDDNAILHNGKTGKAVHKLPLLYSLSRSFAPDGDLLAYDAEGALHVASFSAGKELWSAPLEGADNYVFSPDSAVLAARHWETPGVRLFDTRSGKLLGRVGNTDCLVRSMVFGEDAQTLFLDCAGESIDVWSVPTRTFVETLEQLKAPNIALAVSPDGASIATLSSSSLDIWSTSDLVPTRRVPIADGTLLAWSAQGDLAIADARGSVTIVDPATGITGPTFPSFGMAPRALQFSPDGSLLAAIDGEGHYRIWKTSDWSVRSELFTGTKTTKFVILGDNITVVDMDWDGIYAWTIDGKYGKRYRSVAGESPAAIATSPDGTEVLVSMRHHGDGEAETHLVRFDLATGELKTLARKLPWFAGANILYVEDGRTALISDPTTLYWLDLTKGIVSATAHPGLVNISGIFPLKDSHRFVAVDTRGSFAVVEATNLETIATMTILEDGEWLATTPEGYFNSSANGMRAAKLVRGIAIYSLESFETALRRPDLLEAKLAGDPMGLLAEARSAFDLDALVAQADAEVSLAAERAAREAAISGVLTTAAAYYEGLDRLESGDVDAALGLWFDASNRGDANASLQLGVLYDDGELVSRAPVTAAMYYRRASGLGLAAIDNRIASLDTQLLPTDVERLNASTASFFASHPEFIRDQAALAAPKETPFKSLLRAILADDAILADQALAEGADLRTRTPDGLTPLMVAAASGRSAVVPLLLDQGAEINATDAGGRSALHFAAFAGARPIVSSLLDRGAHAAATTQQGLTSADMAREGGHNSLAPDLEAAYRVEMKSIQARLNELGYDVGPPDGVVGNKTRTQLAIFGNRFAFETTPGNQCDAPSGISCDITTPLAPYPTPDLIDYLFTASGRTNWGIIVRSEYQNENGKWVPGWSLLATVPGTRKEAEAEALRLACLDGEARNCKIDIAVPAGSCVASAYEYVNRAVVGAVFADSVSANESAMSRCSAQYSACETTSKRWRRLGKEVDVCVPADDR